MYLNVYFFVIFEDNIYGLRIKKQDVITLHQLYTNYTPNYTPLIFQY